MHDSVSGTKEIRSAMLPIGGPLQAPGPVTEEMQEKLRKIRFCVIGTFFAAIGRFCTGDIPGSELLSGIVGIFLLNDDPNVAPCYACLASSPLGQCSVAHGLSCAMTYAFLAGMNAIFLMLKLFTGEFEFQSEFEGEVFQTFERRWAFHLGVLWLPSFGCISWDEAQCRYRSASSSWHSGPSTPASE